MHEFDDTSAGEESTEYYQFVTLDRMFDHRNRGKRKRFEGDTPKKSCLSGQSKQKRVCNGSLF